MPPPEQGARSRLEPPTRPVLHPPGPRLEAAFTVDVEDYFQVAAFESRVAREDWDGFSCRVVANTQRLLQMLARHGVHGTFFILGWVAERYPGLVREIQGAGHEIGSHSYWHRRIYQQTPEEFRADLRRSQSALADVLGQAVTCYRAPTFSITRRSLWALEILVQEGFRVDSSIVPVRHDRYGMPQARPEIHRLETPAGPLWEFPPSVARFGRLKLPVSGGGYFRLYPLALSTYCLARAARQNGHPFMFYVHPWELDPAQPRLPTRSPLTRFRHCVNLKSTEGKMDRLLQRFRFGRVRDVLEQTLDPARPPAG